MEMAKDVQNMVKFANNLQEFFCCIGLSCKQEDSPQLRAPGKCVDENETKDNQGCAKDGETYNPFGWIFCYQGLTCTPEDTTEVGFPSKCRPIN